MDDSRIVRLCTAAQNLIPAKAVHRPTAGGVILSEVEVLARERARAEPKPTSENAKRERGRDLQTITNSLPRGKKYFFTLNCGICGRCRFLHRVLMRRIPIVRSPHPPPLAVPLPRKGKANEIRYFKQSNDIQQKLEIPQHKKVTVESTLHRSLPPRGKVARACERRMRGMEIKLLSLCAPHPPLRGTFPRGGRLLNITLSAIK